MLRLSLRLLVVLALLALAAPVLAADNDQIPLDSDGLPAWSIKAWTDFPVRVVLDDHDALKRLLNQVDIASFNREQVGIEFSDAKHYVINFEPRVTEAEFTALVDAGYRPERLRDLDREGREESERIWMDMAMGKADGLRTDPLNYVPTNDQIEEMLQGIAADYPNLARYFSWGQSVQHRTLHGIVISANPSVNENEPEVRLSSTMHGDEVTGLVNCINLAYYLVEHYGEVGYEDVTNLVDNYELHLQPDHNPDGTALDQRANANGVDLNRNYLEPGGTHTVLEIENVHMEAYCHQYHFVVSTDFHGGALVVNYPWDYIYTLAPDNDALIRLCLEYSTRNVPMYNGSFDQGITNGAQWYVTQGSQQDWVYDQTDCLHVISEVSNTKWPPNSAFPGLWEDNRESMIAFVLAARSGITGVVTDVNTGQPLDATITVLGNEMTTSTDPAHGDYYKLLDDGTFDVMVEAAGYVTQTITGVENTWGVENVVNVAMHTLATGQLSGTVTGPNGDGLDAMVEIRTWPGDELVDSISTQVADGGQYSIDLFYGDYTLIASSTDHFTEIQEVTVSADPATVDFVLGGMVTTYPVDEDFESGVGAFSGDWIIGTPGFNSDQCLTDSEGNYPSNATLLAVCDEVLDFTDVMEPMVSFNAKWNIENSWDAVFFEISIDGGVNWDALAVPGRTEPASGQGAQQPAGTPIFDNQQANFVSCSVDLTDYINETDVRFRFRLATDSSSNRDGFYLDNFKVRITREDDGNVSPVEVPTVAASVRAYPNPFNPQTTVNFTIPRDGQVTLAVFDVQGRLVRSLVSESLPAGSHQAVWDGQTDGGAKAGSGVYFARMISGDTVTGAKLMLVK